MPATLLPAGSRINTNGAGDAYTSGLLVASMLRHSGNNPVEKTDKTSKAQRAESPEKKDVPKGSASPAKKMTPYTLYMRENYVMLKRECGGDKKAIFTMCHEMWENESDDVKAMYDRMVKEEYDDVETSTAVMSDTSMDALDARLPERAYAGVQFNKEQRPNDSLSLESAVQLAGLIAARHVDMSSRDMESLDLADLIQKSIVELSPVPTSEI